MSRDELAVLTDEATERAVLAACMIHDHCRQYALLELEPRHFAFERLRRLFSVIRALDREGTAIDIRTVQSRSQEQWALLAELDCDLPDTSHIEAYCDELKRWTTRRDLAEFAIQLHSMAHSGTRVEDLVDDAEELFVLAARGARHRSTLEPGERIAQIADEAARREPGDAAGVLTGIVDLDRMIGGMEPGHLMVLAARPGMGKTLLAGVIATNASRVAPVLFFSLEMTLRELTLRLLSRETGIPHARLRRSNLSADERERLRNTGAMMAASSQLLMSERGAMRAGEIASQTMRELQRRGNLGLVVIDYLNLMDHGASNRNNGMNEASLIKNTTSALKNLAKEARVPVLVLAQLNRNPEHRPSRRPVLADLRGSGGIEEDADVVLMLYREMADDRDEREREKVLEIHVTKNRHGQAGMVEAYFAAETMEIMPLSRQRMG